MTVKEIIDGLKFTVDMFLLDPNTGETYNEPRNDMDKITIDACKGAIELLEQTKPLPKGHRKLADVDAVIDSLKGIERLHIDDELRSSILNALYANTLETSKESEV